MKSARWAAIFSIIRLRISEFQIASGVSYSPREGRKERRKEGKKKGKKEDRQEEGRREGGDEREA